MSTTRSIPWTLDEVRTAVLELNDARLPVVFTIDGDTLTARWKFDDPAWAPRLEASRGASRNFSYNVRLAAEKAGFRWFEQDAGIDNGRFRAYRGYSRGFSINLLTILVGLVRRLSRPAEAARADNAPEVVYHRRQLSDPLLEVLDRAGWKNKGVTI